MERALPDRKYPTEILGNLLQMENAPYFTKTSRVHDFHDPTFSKSQLVALSMVLFSML